MTQPGLRLACCCLGAALLACAVEAAPLPDSIVACQKETDDARRLACYDEEVRRHAGTPEDRFGLRRNQSPPAAPGEQPVEHPDKDEIENISATVTAISRRPHGERVLTLDNGQVWAQTQAGAYLRVRVGDTVTIRSAALGSYLLSVQHGGSTRVERIR
jgi:hypothetical protein